MNIFGLYERIKRWRTFREAAKALAHLSDRELDDIGVNRHDVSDAVRRGSRSSVA